MSSIPDAVDGPAAAPTTEGMVVRARSPLVREIVELLSSMRFSISVLMIIAIASVIGTVVKQNEPMINYVNQFGPFWFEVFKRIGLNAVYTTAWFFVLLTFLVTSTSLCIARNAPKFLREMRDMRDHVRENSLRAFGHRAEAGSAQPRAALVASIAQAVQARGFRVSVKPHDTATLVAAKAGSLNRLGYICAHCAIVIMAVGYLIDTDLPIRMQMLLFGKQPVVGNAAIAQIPPSARFGPHNMTFRGNLFVPEGQGSDVAIVSWRDGAFVQELPFSLQLKKFIVEYYPTGMPRLFKSEVIVTDKDTGQTFPAEIEVNKPLIHKGIAIYQSSFDDGGSHLKLTGLPMRGPANYAFPLDGDVGQSAKLEREGDGRTWTVEFTGLRAINVENLQGPPAEAADQPFRDHVASVIASTTRGARSKNLHNVGPSLQYKLRAADGTAREFNNYMAPVMLDGRLVFLAGVRDTPGDAFKYLRIPADRDGKMDEFLRLRAALQDATLRHAAAQRFAARASDPAQASMRDAVLASADRVLDLFSRKGFQSMSEFLEKGVPEKDRQRAADVFMRILEGTLWDLWQVARLRDGLGEVTGDDTDTGWIVAAMNTLSDTFFYDAPVLLRLDGFDQVQASVFQLTRSPGKNIVYAGCLLLVIGIFSMFYVRERRAWFWVQDTPGGSRVLMAMSSTRRTLDFEREFASMRAQTEALARSGPHAAA